MASGRSCSHTLPSGSRTRTSSASTRALAAGSGLDRRLARQLPLAFERAPVAQRGKAKQKRSDLRLVGLVLVVTRDGGIPLTWHAYPGDRPDVTQFATMISQLRGQYEAITAAAGRPPAEMTVVFDAGQNSGDNFAHLAGTGLHYVGSVPASDCPDLTALPASARTAADKDRG